MSFNGGVVWQNILKQKVACHNANEIKTGRHLPTSHPDTVEAITSVKHQITIILIQIRN